MDQNSIKCGVCNGQKFIYVRREDGGMTAVECRRCKGTGEVVYEKT